MDSKLLRILVAEPGLDDHDKGARMMALDLETAAY